MTAGTQDVATVTLGGLRRVSIEALKVAGIAEPAREADWLLGHVLGLPAHALLLDGSRPIGAAEVDAVRALIGRRAAREPLQYLLGTQEFRGLEIVVTPDVLIPRPETELLVEETVRAMAGIVSPRIVDVGTGSGCIAAAIIRERPDATVYALDISASALALARMNARRLDVSERIRFMQADLLEAFSEVAPARFDVIVSNPPYIPIGELNRLQPEVTRYEPRTALAAGADGLAVLRRLIEEAPRFVKSGGCLILEMGCGQSGDVLELARRTGMYDSLECRKDPAGIERVFIGRVGSVGAGGARPAGPPSVMMGTV